MSIIEASQVLIYVAKYTYTSTPSF